jgi:8-oxo-dGTP pyrophosphatase MutT (NUDIX family)
MKFGKVRPISICIFLNHDRVLAAEGFDEIKKQRFYRPLGGAIEFGENSAQTVCREIKEEIGAEMRSPRFMGVLENIFTYNGESGHEIVFIYDGELANSDLYSVNPIPGMEDNGMKIRACWMPLDAFRTKNETLYPTGLLELIDGETHKP